MLLETDQVVLVTDGMNVIGKGVIQSLLRRGVNVVVPSLHQTYIDDLRDQYDQFSDRIYGVELDSDDSEGSIKVKEYIEHHFGRKRLDHVISIHEGWICTEGGLCDITADEAIRAFQNKVQKHHDTIRVFYPLLRQSKNESPSFTIVTSTAGSTIYSQDTYLSTIMTAATYGLALALRNESERNGDKVRVFEFRTDALVAIEDTTPEEHNHSIINNKTCGEAIVALLDNDNSSCHIVVPKTPQDFENILHGDLQAF
jgi:NAD(P)-dependent dehydrogenase (short-subunit alcohol dehydrogenase family)